LRPDNAERRVGSRVRNFFWTEQRVGGVYETGGDPDSLRWFRSMTVNCPMTRADRVATLEEAKAQFQKSWNAWKASAKLEEVPGES
jgi:hypothetical protein